MQFARQVVEDGVGIKVTPNGGFVCERRVGVLSANHDVAETMVLAVDGVHYCFGWSSVEHFDVQANEVEDIIDVVACLFP